jgi:hypothetical protein
MNVFFNWIHSIAPFGAISMGMPIGLMPVAPLALQAAIDVEAAPRENLDIYFSAARS